jgi:hypothetical protein
MTLAKRVVQNYSRKTLSSLSYGALTCLLTRSVRGAPTTEYRTLELIDAESLTKHSTAQHSTAQHSRAEEVTGKIKQIKLDDNRRFQ